MRFARPNSPARRGRLRPSVLLPLAAAAVVIAGSSTIPQTLAANSVISLTGSHFEIDADANLKVDGTSGSTDWAAVANCTPGHLLDCTPDSASGSADTSFTAKEDDAVPTVGTGSIPPNKSDLKYFGLYQEGTASNGFLNLFWSRVQDPSGTTNMDFELNQLSTPSANGVTPVRSAGDILITYDLAKGGTQPVLSKREWDGSAWGPATDLTTGNFAVGSINTSAISAADGAPVGAQGARTFGEAQIQLAALFHSGECKSLGSAYLKSRASTAFDSALKDFIPPTSVSISNCGQIVVKKQTDPDQAAGSFNFASPSLTPASFSLSDDGVQTFSDVPAGSYTISESATTGWDLASIVCPAGPGGSTASVSGASAIIDLHLGDTIVCTFNNRQRGSISGTKFLDRNGNGVKDSGEPGLDGFAFDMLDADGHVVTSATSANGGSFGFTNLVPGSYSVRETAQTGWRQTTPSGAASVTVTAGGTGSVVFGNVPLSDIGVTFSARTSPAATQSNITCTGLGSSITGSYSTATGTGLIPGTYSCTVTITAP